MTRIGIAIAGPILLGLAVKAVFGWGWWVMAVGIIAAAVAVRWAVPEDSP